MPFTLKVKHIWLTATPQYASFPLVASKDTCRHIADYATLPRFIQAADHVLSASPTLECVNP